MRDYELDGLMKLGLTKKDIKPWRAKTGIQYRVKVRNETGRLVYISNLESQKKQQYVSKFYKIPLEKLQKHLSPDFKQPEMHRVVKNKHSEIHVYKGLKDDEFYDRIENVLLHQDHAFKFDVAIGYTLVNRTDPLDTRHFHAANHNTSLFLNASVPGPQSVNTRKDAIANMEQLRNVVLEQTIDKPKSAYMLKSIDAFQLTLYYRSHKLGSAEAVIPEVIRQNRHVINFPQPPQSTKCLFFCLAYHLQRQQGKKPACDRMSALTKSAVKKWLTSTGQEFNDKTFPSMYKNLPPVDIYQLSGVEDCFNLNIEVYMFDEKTQEYSRAIDSTKSYESTMSILSHNNHAMYITDPERFMCKHACPKCTMVFAKHEQLRDHKRNKCEKAYIKKFVKKPTLFRPPTNKVARLFKKYGVKGVNPYTDHYLVFDFEAILKHLDVDQTAKRLTFTNAHIPVSVSVHDSLTDETKCFVNRNPKELLIEMFTYAAAKRKLIVQYNWKKYDALLTKIRVKSNEATERNDLSPNKVTESIIHWCDKDEETLSTFCGSVPLIGFNSGRYDLNLIKDELFAALIHVAEYDMIKRNGRLVKEHEMEKKMMKVKAILSSNGYIVSMLVDLRCLTSPSTLQQVRVCVSTSRRTSVSVSVQTK